MTLQRRDELGGTEPPQLRVVPAAQGFGSGDRARLEVDLRLVPHLNLARPNGRGQVVDDAGVPFSPLPLLRVVELKAVVTGLTDGVVSRIRQLLTCPKVVAVGEIGLDYHWDTEPHDVQIACFKTQIEIAVDAGKPIIVHSRSAAADTLRVIEAMYGEGRPAAKMAKAEAERSLTPEEYAVVPGKEWVYRKAVPRGPGADLPQKGVIHAYAYSPEQAKIYTEMGFYLGIGGVLTYRNSRKLKKVVSRIPLERLVLETDCPYLAPEPHRGERNDSRYLREVVRAIAEIKETDEMTVEHVTWENACRLFSIVPS